MSHYPAEATHPAHDLPDEWCHALGCPGAVLVTTAKDVTDEIIEKAYEVAEGWYADSPIEWDDVWDRMEGTSYLDSGAYLHWGSETDTPAMRKIQREVRKMRSQS